MVNTPRDDDGPVLDAESVIDTYVLTAMTNGARAGVRSIFCHEGPMTEMERHRYAVIVSGIGHALMLEAAAMGFVPTEHSVESLASEAARVASHG